MPKLVFPDGSTVFVKNGTTEFPFVSATGGLYHQGTILPNSSLLSPLANVTWPSTVATTLVDTTTTQELINKTINNITVTDPTSDAAGTLTIADGGTLATAGAFQHKFTSTANSAVTLPAATDAMLMWTTEASAKITAPTSQINVLGVAVWPSTAAHTLVATTVTQDLTNKTLNAGSSPSTATHTLVASTVAQTLEHKTFGLGSGETIQGAASTSANISNYGVWSVTSAAAGGVNAYTLAAPTAGVGVSIYNAGVANSSDFARIYSGSTATFFYASDGVAALYAKLQTKYASISLVGVSTAEWIVKGTHGTVALSTA